jgi:hypothetical protein
MHVPLGIRWTIGDVSEAGFEALRLSLHAVVRLFGLRAKLSRMRELNFRP